MQKLSAIGIDPASIDFQCAWIDEHGHSLQFREFPISTQGLDNFVTWIHDAGDPIVALEGTSGLCTPIERALRKQRIRFFSFSCYQTTKYRQSVMGQNKNNRRDAATVAHYALTLYARGRLDIHCRTWLPDPDLRPLTRYHDQQRRQRTRDINRLWKLIHSASPDFYLAFKGRHEDLSSRTNLLEQRGFLRLLASYPDFCSWYSISPQVLTATHGGHASSIKTTIGELITLAKSLQPIPRSLQVLIQSTAQTIVVTTLNINRIIATLTAVGRDHPAIAQLLTHPGIGILTAAKIVAEIIDIRRFANNHKLASYAGLGRREHKTGSSNVETKSMFYNHQLKNAFFTAAKNFTLFNQDSHLAGYYRHLLSRGMKRTEAYKRVARALVRRFYRELTDVVRGSVEPGQEKKGGMT